MRFGRVGRVPAEADVAALVPPPVGLPPQPATVIVDPAAWPGPCSLRRVDVVFEPRRASPSADVLDVTLPVTTMSI